MGVRRAVFTNLAQKSRLNWHEPKTRAAHINLTGHCFMKADVLNGTLFNDILYLSHCVKVGKWGERSEEGERWQVEPNISTGFMP